jgi:hypothetical protein
MTPPRLSPPEITELYVCEARLTLAWREAIHLHWKAPSTDSIGIRSYSILRKTDTDTLFDIFSGSQAIPSSIDTFNDKIDGKSLGFPNTEYRLIQYRIIAVDSLGRLSDTSAACSLYLACQPVLDTVDIGKAIFRWHSQYIQGSVATHIKLWDETGSVSFTSVRQEEFGSWDYPVYFSAKLPDSLAPFPPGTWYFSIYLFAMGAERQSIKVDSFNVAQ